MAINPPSDIVLGVARAADPVTRQVAMQKLAGAAVTPGSAPDLFTGFVDRLEPMGSCSPRTLTGGDAKSAEAYKSFEAFFIQSFIQSMLPKSSEATYGGGTAGEMWRSMSAEHMANAIADAGGIGITERLAPQLAALPESDVNDPGSAFSLSSASGARAFQDWASYLPFIGQGSGFGRQSPWIGAEPPIDGHGGRADGV